MGALNFKGQAPFLTYLTVFKSRLGVINVVLPLTGFAFQSSVALSRRLKQRLSQSVVLKMRDPGAAPVFNYLTEKKLVGTKERKKGRYQDFTLVQNSEGWRAADRAGLSISEVAVFQTDIWLADPSIESTIGVPTPENTDEVLELCFQLGLLSQAKCTHTAAGQLAAGLRTRSPVRSDNPMRLGLEVTALLRQVIEKDGLLIRELLRYLTKGPSPVSRDQVALSLEDITRSALAHARDMSLPPPVIAGGKSFLALIKKTAAAREGSSKGPGVLEHRTSPRLEWLTDFGALTKEGMARNGFAYAVARDAALLLSVLDGDGSKNGWPDDAALKYWRESVHWSGLRNKLVAIDIRAALKEGYRMMQRSVGPSAIREVCFAAGVLAPNLALSLGEFSQYLIEWASKEAKITVSGGRYTRTPELIHIAPEILVEG